MANPRKIVGYNLDNGEEVKIIVAYDVDTADQRLNIGGFDVISGFCVGAFTRAMLKPRFVKHAELGIIFFKTHANMIEYLKNNKNNITQYKGEQGNCAVVQLF